MYSKTFKIEQLKDGNWVGIGASFSDEFTGLTEDTNTRRKLIIFLSLVLVLVTFELQKRPHK